MKHLLILIIACLVTSPSKAEQLALDYSTFYSHLKKIDDEDMSALQFAFGFIHVNRKDLCNIKSVQIVTQKKTIDIVPLNNRFILPTEKALKQARAAVTIELDDVANQCDMSVQLETKSNWLKPQYNQQELLTLWQQYENFFDDMGSFLSFLMPSVNGLQFTFEHTQELKTNNNSLPWINNRLVLTKEWITSHDGLNLGSDPVRITATTK